MNTKRQCYIHIGMHKTGSSSIQETLAKKEDLGDYYYADLGSSNHSGKIFSVFSDSSIEKSHLKRRGLIKKEIELFIKQAKDKLIENCKKNLKLNMILSGEGILNLSLNDLKNFKKFLNLYFEEVIIVGYVRSALSYIESSFQQRVKAGISKFKLNKDYPNYRDKFEKFDTVFGVEKVHLWKFDTKTLKKSNVVIDFCNRLSIPIQIDEVSRSNDSINREVVSLLYIYYKFGPGYGTGRRIVQENNRLINKLSSIGTSKVRFSSKIKKNILLDITEDIKWMETRLKEKLNEPIIDDSTYIDDEKNLLKVDKEALNQLKSLINPEYLPCGLVGSTLKEIAMLVHCLRLQLANLNNNIKEVNANNSIVLYGKKGFLFLNEGNQRVSDYLVGFSVPEEESIQNFVNNLKYRNSYCNNHNIIYKHFIFPEKLYSLRHLTDLPIYSLYKKFYKGLNCENSVYFDFTQTEAEAYYHKFDTHCNLYGNINLLLKILDIDEDKILQYISMVKNNIRLKHDFRGDLGKKIFEQRREVVVRYKANDSINFSSNGLQEGNNGILNIVTNEDALYNKKLLIFGDSFFNQMLVHLAHFYKEIIFCRTPFFHKEVADACSPDIIFTGSAERYLSRVSLDVSRYNFFAWPMLEGRGVLPSEDFSLVMRRVFEFDVMRYGD